MASGGIKGFYCQKKKGAGITKPSAATAKKRSSGKSAATLASFDLDDEFEPEELRLLFDMDMRYGPCIGLTRLECWDRASMTGLNPSQEIADLLHSGGSKPALECLWNDRM